MAIGIHIGPVIFSIHPGTENERQKSSEGFSINLTKRIEGVSRLGSSAKIFLSKEAKYFADETGLDLKYNEGSIYELKGISTPPYLHELVEITDNRLVLNSPIISELSKINNKTLEMYYHIALVNTQEFWLRKLVGYILLASKDKRAFNIFDFTEEIQQLRTQGDGYLHLKEFSEAIKKYSEALEIDPLNYSIRGNLGIAYGYIKQYENAIEVFKELLKLRPDDSNTHYNLSCIYALEGDLKNSIVWLKKAINLDPKNIKLASTDKDFNKIKNKTEFKNIINKNYKKNLDSK